MRNTGFKESESAVSEVIDFIIILAVMLLSLSMIVAYGFPVIENAQDAGHTENIRQSFTVLAANLNKIIFGSTPSQSVELKIYGGSLSVTGTSTINITSQVWNSSSSSIEAQTFERQLRMIESSFEGTSIGYENTGTWVRYQTGNTIMESKPEFSFDGRTLVIPVSLMTGSKSTGGIGLVSISSDSSGHSIYSYQNVSQVEITIKSKYYRGWESYLEGSMGMSTTLNDTENTVHAQRQFTENIDIHILDSPMRVDIE